MSKILNRKKKVIFILIITDLKSKEIKKLDENFKYIIFYVNLS